MGPEVLARRLAERTNTLILERVLLGEGTIHDLPPTCMIWTGAMNGTGGKYRIRKERDDRGNTWMGPRLDRSYPVIRYQKKKFQVARLIFQILFKPDYEFRLHRTCNGPDTCVNPLHWSAHPIQCGEPEPEAEQIPEIPIMGDAWTIEEVEELVELALEQGCQSMSTHPDLFDAPRDMLRDVLAKLNKEDLL